MANTYSLIASTTLGAPQNQVTFLSIPQTYTDLALRCSIRSAKPTVSFAPFYIWANNAVDAHYAYTRISGGGTAASQSSARQTSAGNQQWVITTTGTNIGVNASGSSANTFSLLELYFPNYSGSLPKTGYGVVGTEDAGSTAYIHNLALLKTGTDPLLNIGIEEISGSGWAANSSFYLYGIKNS